jgi:hypothetical protein
LEAARSGPWTQKRGRPKKLPAELPAGESEPLYGMEAIARWLGMTRGPVGARADGCGAAAA